MTDYGYLAAYCAMVLVASLFGGYLPFMGRVTHSRLQIYLSISAGVMLGASFFHVMPEAISYSGVFYFGLWMSVGVVGLFCIERFIAPHSHEVDGGKHPHEDHHHAHDHGHGHGHDHGHETPAGEHPAAAPAVAGWMAVLGLTIHTFMNGFGLAGAVQGDLVHGGPTHAGWLAVAGLPGLAMFLAIVLHKPADALAISTVLSRKGVKRGLITLVQLGFATMVPIGVLAFQFMHERLEEPLEGPLTGAALAFSAGTFLFIALSDLLPEVQFHRHDRIQLFLALTMGVALMGGIALLEGHEHGGQQKTNGADKDHEADPDKDHEHGHDHGGPPHKH